MSKSKKAISIALSSAMLITVFAGCTKSSNVAGTDSSANPQAKRYKLSYFNSDIDKTIPNGYAMNLIKDKFNVDIEFKPRDSDKNVFGQQLLVKVASGEIPDVWQDLNMPFYDKLVEQGAVAEVPPDLLEKYAPKYVAWLKKNLGSNPYKYSMRNGKNYSMPIIWTLGLTSHVLGFRQDWLEKVGINKMPETLDEMEAALLKFRNDDPDGNGKKDTYGWSSRGDLVSELFAPVFGAFGVYPGAFTEGNGKLVRGEIEPGAKEALTILNKWYKEDLLDPEFVINKTKNIDDKVISGKTGAVVRNWYYFIPRDAFFDGKYYEMVQTDPKVKWSITAGPKGPQGIQGMTQENPIPSSGAQFGKHMEKEPDKMIKYIQIAEATAFDPAYYEGTIYGQLGKTYEKTKDGDSAYIPPYDKPEEQVKFGIGSWYNFLGKSFNDYDFQKPYMTKKSLMTIREKAESTGKGKYDIMSPIQRPIYNDNIDQLDQLTMKTFADFITGKKPLSEFNSYVDEWKKIGGTKVMEESQKKYDELLKGK